MVRVMRRRLVAAPPKLTPIEAGCCLVALEILRRLGMACPSDAEVLGCLGVNAAAGDDVDEQGFVLKSQVLDCLIDGLLTHLPAPTSPA